MSELVEPPDGPQTIDKTEPPPAHTTAPEEAPPVAFEAVAALLERHRLPGLRSVEPISDGDEDALILNREMVLLLNRREPYMPTLQKEAAIYRRLRRATGVPCPEVLALDTARDLVPYDALIVSRLAGVSAATVWTTLDDDSREALSEEAGRIIGTIHGLQWPAYGDFDVETGAFGQYPRWTDMLLARLEGAAAQAVATGALPQPIIDGVVIEINDGDSVLETASPPVLVHGDLHTANLLVEQREGTWHVAAILDWDWALTADAAWEFAGLGIRHAEREPFHDAFLYGYRERHPSPADLRSRVHLYRLMLHLEGAIASQTQTPPDVARRRRHEIILRRMLRK